MNHKANVVLMLVIAFIVSSIVIAVPVQALPTTYYVNIATGNDGNTPAQAQIPATPWKTISHAVSSPALAIGDTINVAAGIYDETVHIVTNSLTLTGQPGAIIQPDNLTPLYDGTRRPAIYVTAHFVTIQGFVIDGTAGTVHYGIYGFNTAGLTIQNNTIHDMKNDFPGPDVGGNGIIVFGWDSGVPDNLITNNVVYNTARMGIAITAMRSSDYHWLETNNNTISYNEVYNTWQGPTGDGGGGIQVNGATNTLIAHNKVHNTKAAWFYVGIYVYGSSTGNSIQCNDVYNNAYGIVTSIGGSGDVLFGGGTDIPTSPATHNNNIYYNTGYGVYNIAAPTLDATSNWWGSTNGPGTVGPGSGDHVNAGVDYSSYLNAPAPCAPHFTLTVYSDHDSPSPPVGANIEPPGWIVTASLSTSTVPGPTGTQYVSTGWTGTGDVTALTFTVTQDSSITWNWKTQHYLTVKVDPTGIVPIPGGAGWYDSATPVTLTAPAGPMSNPFLYWDVDGVSQGGGVNPITVTMSAAHTATAHYYVAPVGGEWAPINTVQLLAPYVALALIAVAALAAGSWRLIKKRW